MPASYVAATCLTPSDDMASPPLLPERAYQVAVVPVTSVQVLCTEKGDCEYRELASAVMSARPSWRFAFDALRSHVPESLDVQMFPSFLVAVCTVPSLDMVTLPHTALVALCVQLAPESAEVQMK